jgi:hypothetical protein
LLAFTGILTALLRGAFGRNGSHDCQFYQLGARQKW